MDEQTWQSLGEWMMGTERITAEEYRRRLAGRDPRDVDPATVMPAPKAVASPQKAERVGPIEPLPQPECQEAAAATARDVVVLSLSLPLKGKARPRAFIDRGGEIDMRKPKSYAQWLRRAVRELKGQWHIGPLDSITEIYVTFFGGSRSSDGDNCIGSVLDALVKAGILRNDNLVVVPQGTWKWVASHQPRIEIRLNGIRCA